jgi:hypothetical protein
MRCGCEGVSKYQMKNEWRGQISAEWFLSFFVWDEGVSTGALDENISSVRE